MKIIGALIGFACLCRLAHGNAITGVSEQAPAGALMGLGGAGFSAAGFRYEWEHRELRAAGRKHALEARRPGVFISHAPLPWATLTVGLGIASADLDERRGSYGLDWSMAGRIGVFEQIIDRSPVRGVTRLLRLDAGADYRSARSDLDDAGFDWREWRFLPTLSYAAALPTHPGYRLLHAEAAGLHAGMVFSRVSGRLDGLPVSEDRDFGIRLGAGIRIPDGWIVSAEGIAYRKAETSVTAGVSRRF